MPKSREVHVVCNVRMSHNGPYLGSKYHSPEAVLEKYRGSMPMRSRAR
jgi:hypothetical protein